MPSTLALPNALSFVKNPVPDFFSWEERKILFSIHIPFFHAKPLSPEQDPLVEEKLASQPQHKPFNLYSVSKSRKTIK